MSAEKYKWQSMETAPKDGTWIILDFARGGHVYEPVVGRWNPSTAQIGNQTLTYEWEMIFRVAQDLDEPYEADSVFNHYSDGCVSGWMPLPPLDAPLPESHAENPV